MRPIKVLLLLIFPNILIAQIDDSTFVHKQILDGIKNTYMIIEGEVISQTSYYNTAQDFIYTSSIVAYNQVWKEGEIYSPNPEQPNVEIITQGGQVGTRILDVSHETSFDVGSKGVFFLEQASFPTDPNSSVPTSLQMQIHDGIYFEFNYSMGYISTSFSSFQIECVDLLYELIDSNNVAECLDIWPNGILQQISYANAIAISNVKFNSASNGTVDLTSTFENFRSFNDDGTNYVEFDIYLSASSSIYFDFASIIVSYDTNTFGNNVVTNNNVTVRRGSLLSNISTYNYVMPSDISGTTNTFGILGGNLNSTTIKRTLLGTTAKHWVTVKMEVSSITNSTGSPNSVGLAFNNTVSQATNEGAYSTSFSSSNISSFQTLFLSDTENSQVGKLTVTSVSPSVVRGGIGDVITIQGTDFGTTKGTVHMLDASNYPSQLELDAMDIISWSNNQIEFEVPSYTYKKPNGTPGSGSLRIENAARSMGWAGGAVTFVTVEYSRKNWNIVNLPAKTKGKVYLGALQSVLDQGSSTAYGHGYNFTTDNSFTSSQSGIIDVALSDWICVSEVRWAANNTASNLVAIEDNSNNILLGNTYASGVLGKTFIWSDECEISGVRTRAVMEIDIIITNKASIQWFESSDPTKSLTNGKYDFYSIILHELGHADLMEHVIIKNDLMRKEIKPGDANGTKGNLRKIFFTNALITGSSNAITESTSLNYNNNPTCLFNDIMDPMTWSPCNINYASVEKSQNLTESNVHVYPNPYDSEFHVQYEAKINDEIQLELFDLNGKKIKSITVQTSYTGINEYTISTNDIKAGIYFLHVLQNNNSSTVKLIKL